MHCSRIHQVPDLPHPSQLLVKKFRWGVYLRLIKSVRYRVLLANTALNAFNDRILFDPKTRMDYPLIYEPEKKSTNGFKRPKATIE